jgi:KUP system potassium uptake protein
MIATLGITIAFQSSDRLAGAYGTAVSTTMLLTTGLLFTAMRNVWRWPAAIAAAVAGVFLIVDAGFFSANLLKIVDGGWLPLTIGALVFFVMATWRSGLNALTAAAERLSESPKRFVADLEAGRIPRVPGTAIFLTRTGEAIPPLMVDHVKHMGALHRSVLALSVIFEETPRVFDHARCAVQPMTAGIWRVTIRYGFIEIPDLALALKRVKGQDPSVDVDNAIYFATRDLAIPGPASSRIARWTVPIFAFLYRNAIRVVDRFNLPPANVVEVARQIEI